MANIVEDIQDYVKEILNKVGLLKTKQLQLFVSNKYQDLSDSEALDVLKVMQRSGYLYMSQDGWAMNKGTYERITGDTFHDKCTLNNYDNVITFDIGKEMDANLNIVDCLWPVADMAPRSENFVLTSHPWSVSFAINTDKDGNSIQGRLYQVLKVPNGSERIYAELIRQMPKIQDKDTRESIRRIVIIDDENDSWMIPHLGVSCVICLDENEKRGFKIIEKRSDEDLWSDYVESEA